MTVDGVSVIVPTYDDPEHLPQVIESVLSQSASGISIEVIVIDSSSDEAVRSIAKGYGDQVRYEWTEPTGVAAARNRAIELASHDVIGFCDADDYWHEEKLELQLPRIEAGFDLVYSDEYLLTDGSVSRLGSLEIGEREAPQVAHFRRGGVGSRSVLVRRECLERERFDERFVVREDPHLWTRLFSECRVTRVPKPLSYKRRRSGSLTADRDRAFRMELLEIDDLVSRHPELAEHREEREASARLLYAKTLLSDEGRPRDARRVLSGLITDRRISARTVTLWIVSALPFGNETVLRALQRLRWRLRASRMVSWIVDRLSNRGE